MSDREERDLQIILYLQKRASPALKADNISSAQQDQ